MTNQEFYELSQALNSVYQQAKGLLSLHASRYRHFVDGSDRGFDCTYAQLTRKYYDQEEGTERVRAALMAVKSEIERLLLRLEQQLESLPEGDDE